jgi:hypothetical protein
VYGTIYASEPFADLAVSLRPLRVAGSTAVPGEVASEALERFLSGGWAEIAATRRKDLEECEPGERQRVEAMHASVSEEMRSFVPETMDSPEAYAEFEHAMAHQAVLAGERICAMRISGALDREVGVGMATLGDALQQARLVGEIHELLRREHVTTAVIGPSVVAAIMAFRNRQTIDEVFSQYPLARGARLPESDVRALAEQMLERLQGGQDLLRTVEGYAGVAADAFRAVSPGEEPSPLPAEILRMLPRRETTPVPAIDLGPLIAFASTALAGDARSRFEGSLGLYRSVLLASWARDVAEGHPHLDPAAAVLDAGHRRRLTHETILGLRRLARTVSSERSIHQSVEKRWKEIDREMQMLARANPDVYKMPYPFPEEMSALECRALCVQDAIARGTRSVGQVHAELVDDPHLTFGPTERAYFSRLAMYAGRKYAANFFSNEDPLISEIAEHDRVREEDLRRGFHEVEVALRWRRDLDIEGLAEAGQQMVLAGLRRGTLRFSSLDGVPPRELARVAAERMALRIAAFREIELLTGFVAAWGEAPAELLQEAEALPHHRALAWTGDPDTLSHLRPARNGQLLSELDASTRHRWRRYRQQAISGEDVRPIHLEEGDEDAARLIENPMGLRAHKPFGRDRKPPPRGRPSDDRKRPRPS